MPLVYCDHNFVVTSGQQTDDYKNHLRKLTSDGTVTFVLSPFHWIEMAEDADVARRQAKADYVDSLNPQWLRERRNIEAKEVESAFYDFAKIPHDPPQMVVKVTEVIADLAGQPGDRPSRNFVEHLRGIGPNHPIRTTLNEAFAKNQANIASYQKGMFTPTFRRGVEVLYVERLLPTNSPAGLIIDDSSKKDFLRVQKLTDFPAIAVETLATYDNWAQGRQLAHHNFLDQQHVVALPYVNLFITDDKSLTSLISMVVKDVPFPCAKVITKAEFDASYP